MKSITRLYSFILLIIWGVFTMVLLLSMVGGLLIWGFGMADDWMSVGKALAKNLTHQSI